MFDTFFATCTSACSSLLAVSCPACCACHTGRACRTFCACPWLLCLFCLSYLSLLSMPVLACCVFHACRKCCPTRQVSASSSLFSFFDSLLFTCPSCRACPCSLYLSLIPNVAPLLTQVSSLWRDLERANVSVRTLQGVEQSLVCPITSEVCASSVVGRFLSFFLHLLTGLPACPLRSSLWILVWDLSFVWLSFFMLFEFLLHSHALERAHL